MPKVEIEKADLDGRNTKIKQQGERIKELEAQINNSGSQNVDNKVNNFTKEDREELGELYEPMKKLVEASMGGLAVDINKNFSGITDSIKSLQDNIQDQNKSLFSGVASTTLKNYAEVKDTQEFKDFLETEVEGVGITWADAWADAEAKNDIKRLQQIVNKVPVAEQESTEENEEEENNFEPAGGSSTSEINLSNKFKYKLSDYQSKVEEYKKGDIDIDSFEKFENEFHEAVDKGQVLDDSTKD